VYAAGHQQLAVARAQVTLVRVARLERQRAVDATKRCFTGVTSQVFLVVHNDEI